MRRLTVPGLLLAAAVALTACGTSEPAEPQSAGSSSAQPVSITDARNKKIDLPGPATRVVGLEWGLVENLVTLGVMPVGVSDVKGYGTWVTAAKLDGAVKDVGTRGEESLDSIVALDPDLVMVTQDASESQIAQIEKVVPVMVVPGSDATAPIAQMKKNLETVGQAVGRTEQARQVNAAFDRKLAEGKAKIAAANPAGRPFVMADGYKQGSTITIRMYTSGSLMGAAAAELGLKNGWTGAGDKVYGLAQTDIEGLTRLGDAEFFYIASDGDDVFTTELARNAIWTNLPFVKSGSVNRLPNGIWMFGGPRSTEQFVDAAVQAVTS